MGRTIDLSERTYNAARMRPRPRRSIRDAALTVRNGEELAQRARCDLQVAPRGAIGRQPNHRRRDRAQRGKAVGGPVRGERFDHRQPVSSATGPKLGMSPLGSGDGRPRPAQVSAKVAGVDERLRRMAEPPNFAALMILLPDGSPQTPVMWFDVEGDRLAVNTEPKRQKHRNIRRHPRVTLTVWDRNDPYHYVEARGRAVAEWHGEEARAHQDRLSIRYTGVPYDTGHPDRADRRAHRRRTRLRAEPRPRAGSHSRLHRTLRWAPPGTDSLVLVDEAHLMCAGLAAPVAWS